MLLHSPTSRQVNISALPLSQMSFTADVAHAEDWASLARAIDAFATPLKDDPLVALALKFVGQGFNAVKGPLTAFRVTSINEWSIPQIRVLVLSSSAAYRVKFKQGAPVRFHKMPYDTMSVLVKVSSPINVLNTASTCGLQVYTRTLAHTLPLVQRLEAKANGKQHVEARFEYIPLFAMLSPSEAVDMLAAIFLRAEALFKVERQGSWQSPTITEWAKCSVGDISGRWKGRTSMQDHQRAKASAEELSDRLAAD